MVGCALPDEKPHNAAFASYPLLWDFLSNHPKLKIDMSNDKD